MPTPLARSCLAALAVAVPAALAPAQTIDLLANPSQWSDFGTSGTGSLQPSPNILWYQSTGTEESFAGQYINSFNLPAGKDWSVQSTVFINNSAISLPTSGNFVDLTLAVIPKLDLKNSRITYAFEYGNWGSGLALSAEIEAYNAGTKLVTGLNSQSISSPLIGLRMDYSAASQSITFLFDQDGAGTSFTWENQGTLSLSSYWLSADDEFMIALAGASEGTALGYTAFFRDASSTIAIPEASTNALLFGAAALAAVIIRRRVKR